MKYVSIIILLIFSGFYSDSIYKVKIKRTHELVISIEKINVVNGIGYFQGKKVSGTVFENYASGILQRKSTYKFGEKNGEELSYFENGGLSEMRYFAEGEKIGIHKGWWPNGNKRFEYQFSSGTYNGIFKEWYENGRNYKNIKYINGKDVYGKGWRENGKLFMNYIVKDGRRYGIVNSNLCFTIKGNQPVL